MAKITVVRQASELLAEMEARQKDLHLSFERPELFIKPGLLGERYFAAALNAVRQDMRQQRDEIGKELSDIGFVGDGIPANDIPAIVSKLADRVRSSKTGRSSKNSADRSALARAAARARWDGVKRSKPAKRRARK